MAAVVLSIVGIILLKNYSTIFLLGGIGLRRGVLPHP